MATRIPTHSHTFVEVVGTHCATEHGLEAGVVLTRENRFSYTLVHFSRTRLSLSKNYLQLEERKVYSHNVILHAGISRRGA